MIKNVTGSSQFTSNLSWLTIRKWAQSYQSFRRYGEKCGQNYKKLLVSGTLAHYPKDPSLEFWGSTSATRNHSVKDSVLPSSRTYLLDLKHAVTLVLEIWDLTDFQQALELKNFHKFIQLFWVFLLHLMHKDCLISSN